jgi:tryptophan 2,3-dioxygenase
MNYWDYIRVEDLLALQGGLYEDDKQVGDDECLFIVAHQVYELWFKLVLRELVSVRAIMRKNPVPDVELALVARKLRRISAIFRMAVSHFELLETLTTRDYLAFRDRLFPASGFQSSQLREIEIVLGLDDARRIRLGPHDYKAALRDTGGKSSPALERVEARLAEGPSLKEALYDWLARTPIDGEASPESTDRFLSSFLARHRAEIHGRIERMRALVSAEEAETASKLYAREMESAAAFLLAEDDAAAPPEVRRRRRAVRAAVVFLESYRELPRLAWPRELVDAVIVMEQAMVLWRQRHARMVERVIGRRVGTGGSSGVDYLDQTALQYRVFDDVWAVRTLLLRQGSLPTLVHADDYGFRVEDE